MSNSNLKYLIALTHFPKFGPRRIKRIKKRFPRLKNVFAATAKELMRAGIEENIAYEFIATKTTINPDEIIHQLDNENIKVIALENESYPRLLAEIYDPPPLLYYRGKIKKDDDFSLAVVGTRKLSSYGRQVAENIVGDLASNKITIISGLAHGIDTVAHRTALDNQGRTVAVLGTGLDKQSIYPSSNRYLAEKIANSGGLILSEFPPGTPPLRHNFPQRNRIISGLSLGTLVVEAGKKSGALITANFSLEQNREVFAVPGSIYSSVSVGPNNLIKQGAKPIVSGADIMEALDLKQITSYIDNKKIIPSSKEEEKIVSLLTHEPIHIDELIRQTGINASAMGSTLVMMEMKGLIKNLGGMQYVLAR